MNVSTTSIPCVTISRREEKRGNIYVCMVCACVCVHVCERARRCVCTASVLRAFVRKKREMRAMKRKTDKKNTYARARAHVCSVYERKREKKGEKTYLYVCVCARENKGKEKESERTYISAT